MNCITEEDIHILLEIFRDKQTRRCLPELHSLVRNRRKIRLLLSSFEALRAQDDGLIWGIRLNSVLIGFVAVIDLSMNPTIVYAMHQHYRRNGYMKECAREVVHYVLEEMGCHYIQSEVNNGNERSISLLQSIGFNIVHKDGRKTYLKK